MGPQLLLVLPLFFQLPQARVDPSPHTERQIDIRPNLQLEVLDWGGRGPWLVLLPGFGDTAHVFDEFAPQFASRFHVLGITRRGFGRSGRPTSGFDTATLAEDILLALDSLGISRAAFVGHSFAGSELNYLGAVHPERVMKLVYLDASYDFPRLYADPRWQRAYPIPRPPTPPTKDAATWARWFSLTIGPGFPPAEVWEMNRNPAPGLDQRLEHGAVPVDRSRIGVPVLALWAAPRTVQDQYPYWVSMDSGVRARLDASFALTQAVRTEHLARFRHEVPRAQLVVLPGARHFVFLSDSRITAEAILAFVGS
jgi:pimeloyl-ACP methyl ester carboxylesterase